jgi:hypothetical protein
MKWKTMKINPPGKRQKARGKEAEKTEDVYPAY